MVSYPLNTPGQAQPLPIGGGLFFALFRANVAVFVSGRPFSQARRQSRHVRQNRQRKKRDGLLPLRSEIRWALFVVLYQVSAHLYAIIGVPEPQDQLTI